MYREMLNIIRKKSDKVPEGNHENNEQETTSAIIKGTTLILLLFSFSLFKLYEHDSQMNSTKFN